MAGLPAVHIIFLNTSTHLLRSIKMYTQYYLINAIETVLGWDISEDLLPLAINDQAKLMAGFDAEQLWLEIYD